MPDVALDLRYLRYAIAAAEHGSFRRAAVALGVQQSAVSRRIQVLEHRLGAALFDRSATGIRLTTAGQQFLEDAREGAEQLGRAVDAIGRISSSAEGGIRVGILAPLSSGSLRAVLRRYGQRYPGIRTILQIGTVEEQVTQLINGQVDLAFLPMKSAVTGCEILHLWTETMLIALPADHSLAQRESVSWSEIRLEKFLVTRGGGGPKIADHLIIRLGSSDFQPAIESHDVGREDLIHMVAMGFGLVITSTSILGTHFPDVVFLPISGEIDALTTSALWLSKNRNPAVKRLVSTARILFNRQTPGEGRVL